MRLGEILVGAEFISAVQLARGLDYAKAKAIPIGRVLKLLNLITEQELTDALVVQEMVAHGLDSRVGILVYKRTRLEGVNIKEAFANTLSESSAVNPATKSGTGQETTGQAMPTDSVMPTDDVMPMQPAQADAQDAEQTARHCLAQGDEFFQADKCKDAEVAYKKACELYAAEIGDTSLEFAEACLRLANLYLTTDNWQNAEELYLRVLDLRRQKLGENDPLVARSLEDLGDLYATLKNSERALQYYQMALLIQENSLPGHAESFIASVRRLHPYFLQFSGKAVRTKTGEILIDAGMLPDKSVNRGLQSSQYKKVPLATVLADDGAVTKDQVASVLAMQMMVRQRQISEFIGLRCLRAAPALKMNFNQLVEKCIFLPETDEFYPELMKKQEELLEAEFELGSEHLAVAQLAVDLAAMHMANEARLEAEFLYKRAFAIWSRNEKLVEPQQFYDCASILAELHMERESYDDAEPLLMHCLSFDMKSGNNQANLRNLMHLAKVKDQQGSPQAAASFLRSALSILPAISRPPILAIDEIRWMAEVLLSVSLSDDLNRLIDLQVQQRRNRNLPVEGELESLRPN